MSRANACDYCVAHHQAALNGLGEAQVLSWAERLTRRPESASAADVEEPRAIGLTDRAILDAISTVGYFNCVNRLVLATGLAVEPDDEQTCRPTLGGE